MADITPNAGEAAVTGGAREIVHREDDRLHHAKAESDSIVGEETIEGDAIFNNEVIASRIHEFGNLHDADEPAYRTVGGSEAAGSRGRLPNYPDGSQGLRSAQFEANLRRQRPKTAGG